jgi:hypothetical protein
LNYIAVKSAAKWSLASNAIKHPPVLEACRQAEARTTGARLSLLEIQAEAHLAKWELTEAEKVLDEYLRSSPDNRSLAQKRGAAADGVVAIPRGEPRTAPLLNRLGAYAAAFIGVFLFAFEDLSFAAIEDLVKSSFWITTISGIVSLLLAIGIGALRQLYNGLLERAVAIPTNRGPIYVGTFRPSSGSMCAYTPHRGCSWMHLVSGRHGPWPAASSEVNRAKNFFFGRILFF